MLEHIVPSRSYDQQGMRVLPQAHDVLGMIRQQQGGGGAPQQDAVSQLQAMGVTVYETGKDGRGSDLPWDYLAGLDDVKKEVEDTVMLPLSNPGAFQAVVRATRGEAASRGAGVKAVLFEGPPGQSKFVLCFAGCLWWRISVEH